MTNSAPSIEFLDSICDGGTPVATCGFCGVVTLGHDSRDMDDGEYEQYIAKAAAEPSKYREDFENESIAVGEFDGRIVVWGCPCNKLRRYEDWIWHNKAQITNYLRKRAKKDLAEAQANSALLAEVTHDTE